MKKKGGEKEQNKNTDENKTKQKSRKNAYNKATSEKCNI